MEQIQANFNGQLPVSYTHLIRIKKLAQQGEFDYDAVYDIMNEEKKRCV